MCHGGRGYTKDVVPCAVVDVKGHMENSEHTNTPQYNMNSLMLRIQCYDTIHNVTMVTCHVTIVIIAM